MKRLRTYLLVGIFSAAALAVFLPATTRAELTATDCYINNFDSNFTLRKDSTLDVVEKLLVDCGDLGKHGIFRVLPYTLANRPSGEDKNTYVHLLSITDENGQPYMNEQTYDHTNHTVAWKIGNPAVTISGQHTYVIHYTVDNVIQHTPNGEVFSWNLNGNFWLLSIGAFSAKVHFPEGLSSRNVQTVVHSGFQGETSNNNSTVSWGLDEQQKPVLTIISTKKFLPGEGLTLDATAPIGSYTRFKVSFLDQYGDFLWYLLLPIIFFFAWRYWSKYGKDPTPKGAQVVFYQPPGGLKPMELGMVDSFGKFNTTSVTATIIDLAVRGYLTLTEIPKQGIFGVTDWTITLKKQANEESLAGYEKFLLSALFPGGEVGGSISLASLTGTFYTDAQTAGEMVKTDLEKRGFFDTAAKLKQLKMGGVVVVLLLLTVWAFMVRGDNTPRNPFAGAPAALIGCAIIVTFFAIIMNRRSEQGAEIEYEIKGFKEYMSKAEKYRSQFYEKENMFESILPYAILFGLTRKWIKAMGTLYTPEQMSSYVPLWYLGSGGTPGSLASFDSFASQVNTLSAQMNTVMSPPTSSGSDGFSGGGFSGGGGGGGGGGSW